MIAELLDAFPYADHERDERRQRIKGGSDRIYDEYRALAKASAHEPRRSTLCTARKQFDQAIQSQTGQETRVGL